MIATTNTTAATETQPAPAMTPEMLAQRATSAAWHAEGLAREAASYTDDTGTVIDYCRREYARAVRCHQQYTSAALGYRRQLAAAIGEEAAGAMLHSAGAPINFAWDQPAGYQ